MRAMVCISSKLTLNTLPAFALLFANLLPGCIADVSSLTRGAPAGGAGTPDPPPSAGEGGVSDGGSRVAGSGGQPHQGSQGGALANVAGGAGGAAGAMSNFPGGASSCVSSSAEICDGRDNNCDGNTDEGCPAGLAWTLEPDRPQLGDSAGGSFFGEQCDPGEVLTGIKAGVDKWVVQLTGVCSSFEVRPESGQTPYKYQVALSLPRDTKAHPDSTDVSVLELSCPSNQAMVGMRISQQKYSDATSYVVIPRIWINCAQLVISEEASGYSVAWQGAVEFGPLSGVYANGTAWFEKDLVPTTEVPVRLTGGAGGWLDRAGLATGKLKVLTNNAR